MGWVTEHAPDRFDVNTCIQCGLCLPSCPTFRLTGSETASPRGRLTAMAAVADGFEVDQSFVDIMNSCLQCRACEVVCPAFVPFGRSMEGARAEAQAQLRQSGRGVRRVALTRVLRSPRLLRVGSVAAGLIQRSRMWFLVPGRLRGGLKGLRKQALRPTTVRGTHRARSNSLGTAAVLAGCAMDAWFGEVHAATIDVLDAAGYEVIVPDQQTCCGALAAHDGWADEARHMAAVNVAAFAQADVIVVNAAGCGAHLKDYGHWAHDGEAVAAKVRDITEIVAAAVADGRLPRHEIAGTIGIQDPCHLRHAQRLTAEPRLVVEAAGYEPVDIDPSGQCCGAAGIYSILEPELADQLGASKAEQIAASGQGTVASANPGCEMQLRLHAGVEVRHPVELYAEALRSSGGD